jgi:hypothetical protein
MFRLPVTTITPPLPPFSERVHRGETATLPELLPDLLYGFVLPFAGRDAAVGECRAARRRLRAGDA